MYNSNLTHIFKFFTDVFCFFIQVFHIVLTKVQKWNILFQLQQNKSMYIHMYAYTM